MNISKRNIILFLALSIIVGLIIVWLFTDVSGVEETLPTRPAVETILPTRPTEEITLPAEIIEETTAPTEFRVESILFDSSLQYYKYDDESILLLEIDKCNNYITLLSDEVLNYPEHMDIIQEEINRVISIVEQYNEDLKFVNKGVFNVPESYNSRDFKSYEDYRAITSKASKHYKLQNEYAVTSPDGLRKVDDRYCIAVGSYFTTAIGQYIDVILENGTVISCILGDQKSDAHTDALHIAHQSDGSIVEFIVDLEVLDSIPRQMGNISDVYPEWKSPVVQIIVYDVNFFEVLE